ncbi:MAG: T9SS type A sorting domain-containing protein [Candidatus Eisenbacteria bacterium]|uniref:T9SS type A sorting domain-containing protein n=1 Tax=Eiseniibacteriota bacterium TaxID=2212470 RepID=A0A849SD74_UNCEI|nr:T9SS type A sorting domain-containing protein [Candidatus Eisenbacteria bacterium]
MGSNTTNFPVTTVFGTGTYWSTNGGATWSGGDNPGGLANRGDPAAVIGPDGRFMMGYISPSGGQGVSFSTDHGATWTHRTVATAAGLDKNHLAVDNVAGSPHLGVYHNTWSNLGTGAANLGDIEYSRSTDSGLTWSPVRNISNNVLAGSHNQGCNNQVGPNGELYVTWSVYDAFPANEIAIGLNKSTDGGVTWLGESRKITNIRGQRNIALPNTTIRRNSFPSMAVDVSNGPRRGTVYIVWTNVGVPGVNLGTDASIWMVKSTDGGTTFSTPVLVNNDAGTNSQWFPWISCDPVTGNLAVIFYDRRDDPANSLTRVYMATSNSGGATWDNFPVSDVSFTPTPIPGLAAGYMGDYLGIAANNGRAMPAWTDNRTGNFLAYVSPILLGDPRDPNTPAQLSAFSDYSTPTSALIQWADPTAFLDGSPLVDFSIDVLRDGAVVANVDQGVLQFVDSGLIDGQLYTYGVRTRDDVTDSLSVLADITVFAGGSPTPAAPSNLISLGSLTTATIGWTNPTRQSDGTRLDDFAGVRLYRNGALLIELARAAGDSGLVDSYIDTPPPGALYSYRVSAIDSESPVHESPQVAAPDCFVGPIPDILVWQAPGVPATSADSILTALQSLGEYAVKVTSLFVFSSDLNVHSMVFACVGVAPNKHVINATEGAALENFVRDGGRLYLEGGDCFNFDPVSAGGFDLRPMFGLAAGSTGTADLFSLTGLNDLAGFQFTYAGPNSSIDDLVPTLSTTVFRNTTTNIVVSVFRAPYFLGRAIGAAYEFGGLRSTTHTQRGLMTAYLDLLRSSGDPRLRVSTTSLTHSLPQTQSGSLAFTISNPGTPNGLLNYELGEAPDVSWLSIVPPTGSIAANGTVTISANFAAGSLPAGSVITNVVVTSNDPVNSADTIQITLNVQAIPLLTLIPEGRSLVVPVGGTRSDSVSLANTGIGSINYTLDMIGVEGEDQLEFDITTFPVTTQSGWVGNVFRAGVGLPITGIEQWLDIPTATQLEFFIFEEVTPLIGLWRKIFTRTVSSGTGPNWYASGLMSTVLKPTRRYLLGCAFEGTATAFHDDGTNLPDNVAFGNINRSIQGFDYPTPPDSALLNAAGTVVWAQRVNFGIPVDVTIDSPLAGTLGPGESDVIYFTAANADVEGVYTAVLNVFHDAPFAPPAILPLTIGVGDTPVDVGGEQPALPTRFTLHPSRPNPFRGETQVQFDLPAAGHVRLAIYDLSGRRVRVLRDGQFEAGAHSTPWNGTNSTGERVPSGVYFYAIETPTESRRMKLVLLR